MHRAVVVVVGLLVVLGGSAPAVAADNGLTVLAAPPASHGRTRLQVEVIDPSLQKALRASPPTATFRVAVEHGGAEVSAAHRMADAPEGRYTVLAFDQSKSFSPFWSPAFQLARGYSQALGARAPQHTVAVMTFGQSKVTHCKAPSAPALETCLDKVQSLGTDQLVTRLKFYIQEAVREAALAQPLSKGGSREVIVFTDAGEESSALKVKELAREAREKGVRVHLVVFSQKGGKGIAQRLDEMSQLAEGSGGRYLQVENLDARQALAGLAGALEHLYWLDVAFCGVKSGPSSDRLSVEALVNGAPVAWSDFIAFRQRGEGSATAACASTVALGTSPSRPAAGTSTGTSGAVTPPGTGMAPGSSGSTTAPGTPGTVPGGTPGSAPGTPGTSPGGATAPGTPGGASDPAGPTGTPGGVPAAEAVAPGPPLWLIVLLVALVLAVLAAVLLSRRRAPPAPAAVVPPPVAVPPVPEPPAPRPEPAPAPAVWKDPFATLPETRLMVTQGPPGLEPFYRVHKGSFTIGARTGEMDLAVDLPQLSGHHVTVQLFKAGNVFIKDEHSTNGTFVDGRRLQPGERVQVRPGQRIRLSQHLEFTLSQPGLQPEPTAAGVPLVAAPPSQPAAPSPEDKARAKARTIYSPARGEDE